MRRIKEREANDKRLLKESCGEVFLSITLRRWVVIINLTFSPVWWLCL